MTMFVLIAGGMLALGLLFILPGLLRREHAGAEPRPVIQSDALNLEVLRDQLRELDADLTAGTIAAAGYQSARRDLECRVAEQVRVLPVPAIAPPARRWPAAILALAVPLAAGFLYASLGTPDGLASRQVDAAKQTGPAVSAEQIEAMVGRLAQKLNTNPRDADGWRMLARSYETLRRFEPAADAYQHLLELEPDNADVLVDYAVALGMTLNRSLSGEPERFIERALAIDPNHVQALALSGSAAFERGDYANAMRPWKKLRALVPADSDMGLSIAASIAKAESRARENAMQPTPRHTD
jgi:cytochrome c-type biogenesis protein CcmH